MAGRKALRRARTPVGEGSQYLHGVSDRAGQRSWEAGFPPGRSERLLWSAVPRVRLMLREDLLCRHQTSALCGRAGRGAERRWELCANASGCAPAGSPGRARRPSASLAGTGTAWRAVSPSAVAFILLFNSCLVIPWFLEVDPLLVSCRVRMRCQCVD